MTSLATCQHGNRISFQEATKRLLDLSCFEKFNTKTVPEKNFFYKRLQWLQRQLLYLPL